MGNITASANGEATLEATLHDVTLSGGKNAIGGRAIILHEKADDFSQPTGNAGGRIGCGTIVITGN
jgi:Cu-Zn family superoxide dismutase